MSLTRLSLVLFSSLGVAQTYIVDWSNGPGTHFTDLPPAIAAVPSGATLVVRGGTYSPITIQNKSLTILCTPVATGISSPIRIGPTAAHHRVTIAGLGPRSARGPSEVLISGCAGPVLIDQLLNDYLVPACHIEVDASASVHFTTMFLTSQAGDPEPAPTRPPLSIRGSNVEVSWAVIRGYSGRFDVDGTSGIEIAQGSRVWLVASEVTGGQASFPVSRITRGGDGVKVSGASILHAFGSRYLATDPESRIRGGAGSFGRADGGDGLVLASGSSARVLGTSLYGGAPTGGGTPGRPSRVDASSQLEYLPGAPAPSARLVGTVAPGQTIRFSLKTAPGSLASLWLGDAFGLLPPAVLRLGAMGLAPAVVLGPFATSGGGLDLGASVPLDWPSATVLSAQFLTLDLQSFEARASNLFSIVSR